MAGKRRYAWTIMLLTALGAIVLSMSYFGVQKYLDFRESEQSTFAQSTSAQSTSNQSTSSESTTGDDDDSAKPASPASDSSTAQSAKDRDEKDSKGQQQQRERLEEDEDEAEPDYLGIAGAVLDDAGQPLEGARVVAEFVENSARDEDATPQVPVGQQSQITDRLGTFEFKNLDEGEYELTASKGEGFFPALLKVRTGMANAELILQRLRPIRVYGTISDEQGVPLDAVTVRTLGTQGIVQSDANGGYEIVTTPMRAGDPPVLEFKREGYQEIRERVKAALNSDRAEVQLDVQMDADSNRLKVAVSGQILGPIGEAVVGVRVGLGSFKLDKSYSTRTDDSGKFEIPTAEVGEGYRLNVMPSEDYEAYQSEVFSLGPQDAFFEIELDAAKFASLSGTVTDLHGKPLSGFQLWLRGIGTSAQSQLPVQTDSTGRFHLEQLRAGEVVLQTRSSPTLRASNIVLEAGEHRDVYIPLDWGADWLLGRVVDAQGQPVSGASIVLSWKEQLYGLVSESRRDLRSDMEGYFAVSNLSSEHYMLTVQAPGYRTFSGTHRLTGGAEELVVQLQ